MMLHFGAMSWLEYIFAGAVLWAVYALIRTVYLLQFHPLARFPGPKIAAISNAYYAWNWMRGRYPFVIERLHKQYGDVVRIAPNELSFSTAKSFNDIYGHTANEKHATFLKSTFYKIPQPEPGIVAERDPGKHRETRRLLAHGFSAKALKEQESILHEYTDLFVSQVRKKGGGGEGLNMKEWYNFLSFDIIGELAFGESFGAVKNAKTHFWIDTIPDGGFLVSLFEVFRRLPLLLPMILLSIPLSSIPKFNLFLKYSRAQVGARVARQQEITRQDFFGNLLSEKANNKDEEWLLAQANVLIIAGSDTTATALTAITYYLCKNPSKLHRLQAEVREAFKSDIEISNESLQALSYLSAVIEEGLRLFPPTAFGLPRVSPGANVDSHMVPAGVTVSTSSWTTTHRSDYFADARTFAPERWLPNMHKFYDAKYNDDNKSAAKPFSLGPRACLGVNLAYVEMRMVLAKMVLFFDWAFVNAADVEWDRDVRFRGFWNLPDMRLMFTPVSH